MNITNLIDNRLKDTDIIKLCFSLKCVETNIFTNICTNIDIFTKDIINNIIKILKDNKCKNIQTEFKRDHYYSQIRETSDKNNNKHIDIYTEELKLIQILSNDKYNLYISELETIKQDKQSFPNINNYHYSKDITQNIFILKDIEIIIENENIIFIKLQKNYDKNILTRILQTLDF